MGDRSGFTRRLVDRYWSADRLRRRAKDAIDVVFQGVWLGLLDRDALARVDEQYYDNRRERTPGGAVSYFDAAWNTHGLADWEAAAIDAHFPAGGRLVVTGAGGGREVLALRDRGFDAVGFEPHAGLVEAGAALLREHGHDDVLHLMGREGFPAQAGRSDGVVVGWGSYMHVLGRGQRVAFLRAARATLEPGAPLLVSFWVRPESERAYRHIARIATVLRRLRRREPADEGDQLGPHFAHRFVRSQLEGELRDGGFEPVFYADQPYGHAVGRAV